MRFSIEPNIVAMVDLLCSVSGDQECLCAPWGGDLMLGKAKGLRNNVHAPIKRRTGTACQTQSGLCRAGNRAIDKTNRAGCGSGIEFPAVAFQEREPSVQIFWKGII